MNDVVYLCFCIKYKYIDENDDCSTFYKYYMVSPHKDAKLKDLVAQHGDFWDALANNVKGIVLKENGVSTWMHMEMKVGSEVFAKCGTKEHCLELKLIKPRIYKAVLIEREEYEAIRGFTVVEATPKRQRLNDHLSKEVN